MTAIAASTDGLEALTRLLDGRRCVVLSGAGCSTESGIPDYRGAGRPARTSGPIQHGDFLADATVRRRYWARAAVGWQRFGAAEPNAAHRALAELEDAGVVAGIITQNVDRLHHAAGSRRVVELHGALANVVCLDCGVRVDRDDVQARLVEANPGWLEVRAASTPDGDADLAAADVARFHVVGCGACGGVLKPDVVFFGGNVHRDTLADAWEVFAEGDVLLVVGSSLAVFSGFRFARRAAEIGLPIGVVNLGPTRADTLPLHVRVEARAGEILPRLAAALGARSRAVPTTG